MHKLSYTGQWENAPKILKRLLSKHKNHEINDTLHIRGWGGSTRIDSKGAGTIPDDRLKRTGHNQKIIIVIFCVFSIVYALFLHQKIAHAQEGDSHFAYTVVFYGLEGNEKLLDLMQEVSVAVKRQNELPASQFLLLQRANKDQKNLTDALRSQGYFDASVEVEMIGELAPYELIYRIEPKTLYLLSEPRLEVIPATALFIPPSWKKLGLQPGEPAKSAPILKADEELIQSALQQGYPWAKMSKRRVSREPGKQLVNIHYSLELGQLVHLGAVRIQGNESVDGDYLLRCIPWGAGTPFHPKRLEEAHQAFTTTGLFSIVRLQLAKQPDAQGYWPLDVELKERKHRTWRAGAGFSTDQGILVNGGWEHRNFKNSGERLRTEVNLGLNALTWNNSYDKPDFHERGQKLRFSNKLEKNKEIAYESLSMEVGAGVIRSMFGPGGETALSVNYRLSKVLELSTNLEKSYSIVSLPLGITLDKRNDPLDATEGWRLSTEIIPNSAVTGDSVTYIRWNNRGSIYYPWLDSPNLVLAGRLELDATYGADNNKIPADNRLYAGGGSTLRGYGQQLASPLDLSGKPLGGLSLLAMSTEARYRVTDTLGVVAFVDAGRAFLPSFPTSNVNLLYGAGLGLRYMTAIGPLRLDVAVPLDKRESVDAAFQLYMSIGQAF